MRALPFALVSLASLAVVVAACDDPPPPKTPGPSDAAAAPPVVDAGAASSSIYPAPPKSDLTFDLFGTKIADPYRPLEDMEGPATRAWITAENALTDRTLGASPALSQFRARLDQLTAVESNSPPTVRNGKYFWMHDSGKDAQPSLVMATSEAGAPKTILDPNVLSPDGKQSLAGYILSEDASRIAYGMAEGGGDWTTWHVRDLTTGKDLPDALPYTKYYEPRFTKDAKALYYSRFPPPTPGKELSETDHDCKVYLHVIGSDASTDKVVYQRPDHPTHQFQQHMTEDGQYLVIEVGDGEVGDRHEEEIIVFDTKKPDAKPVVIAEGLSSDNWFVGSEGTTFFIQTNEKAPNRRIVAVDLKTPDRAHWKDIVPSGASPIELTSFVGRQLIVNYVQDAHTSLVAYDTSGKKLREVALPGVGSAWVGGSEGKSAHATFFSFETYAAPGSAYRYDLDTGKVTPFRHTKLPFDPAQYDVVQTFYPAKDGTKIPITLTTKKGAARDGTTPTLLNGYGFGGISLMPHYRAWLTAWLETGGAFAVANMRGGGEYGEPWRLAAFREKKQVTYDDFASAAQWLVAQKITSSARLGIFGGSGGGLLVGVAETQHPELFAAVAPLYGVHDMLRFHLFGEGAGWSGDFGSPTVEKEARALYATSPLHNVKPGTRYPATYIVTSDHDVRVAPLHSYKFAATMQAAQAGSAPVLLRVETSTGHGTATTRDHRNDNDAELLAFFARYLESAP